MSRIILAKCIGSACFAMLLCFFFKTGLGQEYMSQDSANYQRMLASSRADSDRINYQLELAEYYIKKPGTFKADLDNARLYIARARQLNEKLKSKQAEGHILLEEGSLAREYGPSPQGKEKLTQAIALLKNGHDGCLLASAYRNLAYYYDGDNPKDWGTKIDLLTQSATFYKQCGNSMRAAATCQHLAEMYVDTGNFEMSKKYIEEGLALYNSVHYPEVQGLYCLMGDAYFGLSDYDKAIDYYLQSLTVSAKLKKVTMQTCESDNHLGLALYELGQSGKALPYFEVALKIANEHRDPGSMVSIARNIANCYIKLNEPGKALAVFDSNVGVYTRTPVSEAIKLRIDNTYLVILTFLNQTDRASVYVDEILHLSASPTIGKFDISKCYSAIIGYYFSTKNYSRASEFLAKFQQVVEQTKIPASRAQYLAYAFRLDSVKGDYRSAFIHQSQYKALEDSLFSEKKSRQIAQLQTEFETQQKEDEIRLKSQDIKLLTQGATLGKAQLQQAKLVRDLTLAGTVVFILIAGMQYRRYREKQKTNLLITDKNRALEKLVAEKEWLLREVHHRVKNNLHTVICLLESQAAYLENDALVAVESSQHRIFAMSLVHQRLYQSADIQTVDIANYLSEFIMYLRESFGSPANITFQQDIGSIRLDVSQAIPLALIVNEAATNAIKYAFPKNRQGVIRITLVHEAGDSIRLSIKDNGVGIPEIVQSGNLNSLGLELIRGLTDDLKGKVQFVVNNGTSVIVLFNKAPFVGLPERLEVYEQSEAR